MRYRLFLILFLVLFATTPGAAAAENSRYRVELIVLTHLGHDEQPRETPELEDYSAALDFLTPPAETGMQLATQSLTKNSEIQRVKREIARVHTVLTEKAKASKQ